MLGGARSGKTSYAQALAESARLRNGGAPDLLMIATAEAGDAEMAARIAHHQAARGPRWRSMDISVALSAALREHAAPDRVILVDCLTLWLSNLMHASMDPDACGIELAQCCSQLNGPVILVSNEVGQGIVPDNALARAFRDHAGRLHQRVAARADRVILITAGLPCVLK